LPPWYFSYCTDNQPSTPSQGSHGTSCTPGVSNADGTAVSLIAAISHDVHRLCVHVSNTQTAGAAYYALLDILIDLAGGSSWSSWIDDLTVGFLGADTTSLNSGVWFDFPIWLPAGASIGAQMRTSHTVAVDARISIWAFGEPSRPDMWWCGQGVETLGVTAASSRGTAVTPGSSSAYGSWTSVGSTTTRRYGAIQLGTNGTDASMSAINYHFQIGRGSQPLPGCPIILKGAATTETGATLAPCGPIWCDIEAGAQLQVRGKASGTAEVWDCALYGVH
jgi:hypothetical protein